MPWTEITSDAKHQDNRQNRVYLCNCLEPEGEARQECKRCRRLIYPVADRGGAQGWLSMPAEVSQDLANRSPRLMIDRPTLISVPGTDSGWLLVLPKGG
jgi:hypothetical protein